MCDLELELLRSFVVRSDSLAGLTIWDFQIVAKGSTSPTSTFFLMYRSSEYE